MYTYKEQLSLLDNIRLKEGDSKRLNCPFCGGYNTFGISKINGSIRWNCFRLSCGVRGVKQYERSITSLKHPTEITKIKDNIPEVLTSINSHSNIINWLKKYHSYEAYTKGFINIKYSPIENRIMFAMPENKGYSGRNLNSYGAKWKKFGDTTSLFTCGKGSIAVLVEDAPSACAVGILEGYTGVSILGTMLTDKHKIELLKFDEVLVCLDPDAYAKGITISRKLPNSKVKLIKNDLKFFNEKEIHKMLNE